MQGPKRKSCAVCFEIYDGTMESCPVCGCPGGRYTIESMGFPVSLNERFRLAGLREGSGRRVHLILEEKDTGSRILAGRLGPDETRLAGVINAQMKEAFPLLPQVYEIIPNGAETVFLFEDIGGQTLREISEVSYPLEKGLTEKAESFMETAFWYLANGVGYTGMPDMNTVVLSDNGFRLKDFGGACREADVSALAQAWKQVVRRPEARGSAWEREADDLVKSGMYGFILGNRQQLIIIGVLSLTLIWQLVYVISNFSKI